MITAFPAKACKAKSRKWDNISVNRQREVPRTGTAQWQDPGDVSCDATQVPMIQKMQKTFEISEIMQSKDKCQRFRRNGNSRKFTDRIVDVLVMLKRHCQPSAQVLDQVPTTGAKDATMQKEPNVSPRANQTPSAKTRLTMSSHERQPVKRRQKCQKHEREL